MGNSDQFEEIKEGNLKNQAFQENGKSDRDIVRVCTVR